MLTSVDIVSPITADTVGLSVILICLLDVSIVGSFIAEDIQEENIQNDILLDVIIYI